MNLPKDIIMFSTADWDNPFWTNKQHTAVSFAKKGFKILYIESLGLRRPVLGKKDFGRIKRRFVNGFKGLRKVEENIWIYSPLVMPFYGNSFIRELNNKTLLDKLILFKKILNFKDPIIWTHNPLVGEIIKKLKPSLVVYHCVDDLASAPFMPSEIIKKEEKELIKRADFIFTSSPALQEYCAKINSSNSFYFPNVADFEHFSKARSVGPIPYDIKNIPHPIIGFIGAISEYKVDFDLINFIAKKRMEWHWVLIGEIGEGDPKTSIEKLKLPNIHFLGPKRYEELPDYLRAFDVATIPAAINGYTSKMFPMKFFEYLAAGKTVVSTNLPALKFYKEACLIAESFNGFISAVEDALNGKYLSREVSLNIAKEHTWDKRTEKMIELMQNAVRI